MLLGICFGLIYLQDGAFHFQLRLGETRCERFYMSVNKKAAGQNYCLWLARHNARRYRAVKIIHQTILPKSGPIPVYESKNSLTSTSGPETEALFCQSNEAPMRLRKIKPSFRGMHQEKPTRIWPSDIVTWNRATSYINYIYNIYVAFT